MTALCAGGPSQVKPGTQQWVVVGSSLITAGLGIITPWLIPLAALIDAFNWQALTECTADPPPMPSAADLDPLNAIGGVINPNFNTWLSAVNNLLLNWLWYTYCQCVTGNPTPATYPPPPTNYQFNQKTLTTPCSDLSWQGIGTSNAQQGASTPPSLSTTLLPYPSSSVVLGTQTMRCVNVAGNVPVSLTCKGDLVSGGNATDALSLYIIVFNSFGGQDFNGYGAITSQSQPVDKRDVFLTANSTDIYINALQSNPSAGTIISNFEVIVNCAGGSGTIVTPCTIDPSVLNLLNQMWTAIKSLYTETTLLQRGLLPFAYISGTVHAGLSGQGTITVSSLLGVKIVLTTVPSHFGEAVGEPTVLFDVGWVSALDANGFIDERRIRATDTVWTPRIMSEATVVGYSFSAGVVATITELQREP